MSQSSAIGCTDDRAMARNPQSHLFGRVAFDRNHLALGTGLLQFAFKHVTPGAHVNFFGIKILDIEAEVGESPGDAVVVA